MACADPSGLQLKRDKKLFPERKGIAGEIFQSHCPYFEDMGSCLYMEQPTETMPGAGGSGSAVTSAASSGNAAEVPGTLVAEGLRVRVEFSLHAVPGRLAFSARATVRLCLMVELPDFPF